MFKTSVAFNLKETPTSYLLGIHCPQELIERLSPGQFLKIKCGEGFDPLIPRPFTIHAVEKGVVLVLYQVRGKGTKLLASLKEGDSLSVLMPLGSSFPKLKNYVVCAGGIGIAGFGFLLQKALSGEDYSLPKSLIYGARTKEELARMEFFKSFEVELLIATEDGSLGKKGFVTDLLEEVLKVEKLDVIACGPPVMLKRVKEIGDEYGVKTYLVMETFLGCGTGFCRGCVIPKKGGGYLHLCLEGPTVDSGEIDERFFG